MDSSTGDDILTSGKGKNIFFYSAGNDSITDYSSDDKITLGSESAVISNVTISENNLIFTFDDENFLTLEDAGKKKI